MFKISYTALVAGLLLFGSSHLLAADKTDVILMTNGDRLVGEIKRLAVGQLQFKATYMASSVNLDQTKVSGIESIRRFRVEFADGSLLSGVIGKSASAPAGENFTVEDSIGSTKRAFLDVVSVSPLEGSFLRRFTGSADVGVTLGSQSSTNQFTANATLNYPSENFRLSTQASSLFSKHEGSDDAVRQSFGAAYYQFLSKNWFLMGLTQMLKDNELSLSLRATGSGGGGRFLMHSNRSGVAAFAGLAATYERYFDTATGTNGTNAELLTGLEIYTVRFASSQMTTKLLLYSGISQWGRERVDWETSISWELWNNVYWKTGGTLNFDSRPPEGTQKSDYTLTTSFGLTF
jgi:Protein of unknown function, DUF481